MTRMLIATTNTVYAWEPPTAGKDKPTAIAQDVHAWAIAEHDNLQVVANEYGGWVHRDNHRQFEFEVEHGTVCVLILSEDPMRLIIGTQEAHLYDFTEQSSKAHRVDAFDQLPCRTEWHTPWGGPPGRPESCRGAGEKDWLVIVELLP